MDGCSGPHLRAYPTQLSNADVTMPMYGGVCCFLWWGDNHRSLLKVSEYLCSSIAEGITWPQVALHGEQQCHAYCSHLGPAYLNFSCPLWTQLELCSGCVWRVFWRLGRTHTISLVLRKVENCHWSVDFLPSGGLTFWGSGRHLER